MARSAWGPRDGSLGDGDPSRSGLAFGTVEGIRSDGKAYVLLDGASGSLALLVGRRVVVLGDDPATWLVVEVFGTSLLNVANGLLQLDGVGNIRIGGVQVVGPRGAAVTAAAYAAAAPTKAEFDTLVDVVNMLRARLTTHGLMG